MFCNNIILGFVYVYYTPWVSHSNEYSSYSDVVHCVRGRSHITSAAGGGRGGKPKAGWAGSGDPLPRYGQPDRKILVFLRLP